MAVTVDCVLSQQQEAALKFVLDNTGKPDTCHTACHWDCPQSLPSQSFLCIQQLGHKVLLQNVFLCMTAQRVTQYYYSLVQIVQDCAAVVRAADSAMSCTFTHGSACAGPLTAGKEGACL